MFRPITRERYLSDDELARFMAVVRERRHVHQPRDRALFALLANTGMRPSEALGLTSADLSLAGDRPFVKVRRLKKKKAAPVVDEVPITAEVAASLSAYLGTPGDVRGTGLFRVARRQLARRFHAYASLAKLRGKPPLYSLRHTAATRIYCATRDIGVVQMLLGHDSPDMSCLYAHVPLPLLEQHAETFPTAL